MNTSVKDCVPVESNETRWMVGGHDTAEIGGSVGKRDTEGDGRGGARRGGNGASSPSEGALAQRRSRPRHGDTSMFGGVCCRRVGVSKPVSWDS